MKISEVGTTILLVNGERVPWRKLVFVDHQPFSLAVAPVAANPGEYRVVVVVDWRPKALLYNKPLCLAFIAGMLFGGVGLELLAEWAHRAMATFW